MDSIIKNTHYPYRLILIDNGSEEMTQTYLVSLRNGAGINAELIRNEKNLGFPKAVNQGFEASNSSYICLLNNDTIVTDGWLNEMVAVAESDRRIGAVNPSSNCLGQYLDGKTIDDMQKSSVNMKGKWAELSYCSGFCMLIKKEVIDKIGHFDEIYTPGYCEDSDFCRRAQKARYIFARAKAAYVYHREGSSSFKKLGEREKIFSRNLEIFFRRWGKPQRIAYIIGNNPNDIRIAKIAEKAAHDNNEIWLFVKKSFSILDISEHSNIKYFSMRDFLYVSKCILKILKRKRKKKMDLILSEDRLAFIIFSALNFYIKAKLIYRPVPEDAQKIWHKMSNYE